MRNVYTPFAALAKSLLSYLFKCHDNNNDYIEEKINIKPTLALKEVNAKAEL